MRRTVSFLVLLFVLAPAAFAQLPTPGDSYDPAKHENPIITFVESKDFKPSTYNEATKSADLTLLGLSKEEGTLDRIAIAEVGIKKVDVLQHRMDVTFNPVVRQTFKLVEGGEMVLHSFKTPKLPLPRELQDALLQEALASVKKKPSERRFGPAGAPEQLALRGTRALLFDRDGDLTIAWQEEGVTYTAEAKVPRKSFFRLLSDLL